MTKRANVAFKLAFLLILLTYTYLSNATLSNNKFYAALTLGFSILLLFKSRKNLPMFLVSFFILYCNYSVVMGEYFIGGSLGVPLLQVKTIEHYGLNIRILLIFTSIVALLYKSRNVKQNSYSLVVKDNIAIFLGLLLILLYILAFGVNRADLSSYSVSITPLYEYSSILFLLAYYFSGNSKIRICILALLLVPYVLQDFYYGGRITSLQLILLFLVTVFLKRLSVKLVLVNGFIGIFLNSLVGAYRKSYSLDSLNIIDVFINIKDNLFVFDTPVFAYYSSATQIAASKVMSISDRLNSFEGFIGSIFAGESSSEIGSVSRYVSTHYFMNVGGGFITSFFYLWLGLAGVILISLIVVFIFNKVGTGKNDYWRLVTVLIIFSTPRWYMYTPLSLIRPVLLFSVLYLIVMLVHTMLVKIAGGKKLTPMASKTNTV
ncbi:hypothetical protein ACMX9J_16015 [Priestia sp. RMT2NF4]|uniref:hypothetical protein n=1 Tax=Priestia sp. RMT2NF4 TaxID=3398394 RepID=UPI003A4C7AC7